MGHVSRSHTECLNAGHLGVVFAYRGPACERLALQIFGVPDAVGNLSIPMSKLCCRIRYLTASKFVTILKARPRYDAHQRSRRDLTEPSDLACV